jgi:hypothetical protein
MTAFNPVVSFSWGGGPEKNFLEPDMWEFQDIVQV